MAADIFTTPAAQEETLKLITALRKTLHLNPELSGEESGTAAIIRDFITANHPTEIITGIGGHGLAAVYRYSEDGPVMVIRCELDALPIEETNVFQHRSQTPGVSHKCGHDGHMAILAGVALWLKNKTFEKGKVASFPARRRNR